jgi:hypothetical protein
MAATPMNVSRLFFYMVIILTAVLKGQAQTENDTLNRYDHNKEKTGFWTFYLDSLFNVSENKNAYLYGYAFYENGTPRIHPSGRFSRKDLIKYIPAHETNEKIRPIKLDGDLLHYEFFDTTKKLRLKETYKAGVLKEVIENLNWKGVPEAESTMIYFDSIYSGQPGTYLYYHREKNVTVYKQYLRYGTRRPVSDEIYLVKHSTFNKIDRPLVGWHGYYDEQDSTRRNYFEVGISRKFIAGTHVDTISATYKKNRFRYHSLNFSIMASNTNNHCDLGQKLTYGYNLLLVRAETGLINYTNFRTNDLSFIAGIGFTVFGFFHEMLYITIPLAGQYRNGTPRFVFSFVIN